ncbi:Hypothetical_protein [Hexamita inflata]|uniref:Hypothetical_protein n=1 Tax=Hexamita inflata TaxID=28002 RepID=A0AA86NTH7_9EUKA|nr:Hypothetical protein HINF_LOCUS12200 [Hexamita inflata]
MIFVFVAVLFQKNLTNSQCIKCSFKKQKKHKLDVKIEMLCNAAPQSQIQIQSNDATIYTGILTFHQKTLIHETAQDQNLTVIVTYNAHKYIYINKGQKDAYEEKEDNIVIITSVCGVAFVMSFILAFILRAYLKRKRVHQKHDKIVTPRNSVDILKISQIV